jgi:L-asparagine oxygenase
MKFKTDRAVVYVLSNREKQRLRAIVDLAIPDYSPRGYSKFIAACNSAMGLFKWALDWKQEVVKKQIGLLRNLPLDDPMPATPVRGQNPRSMIGDKVIGAIAGLFGTVYNITGKGNGRHIQDMYPVKEDEYTQLASSSKADLKWHVEEAFHAGRPTWLALLCLRGDPQAKTKVAHVRDIQLSPEFISTLRQQQFRLRVDETYQINSPASVVLPILSGTACDPHIVLDPAYTIFESKAQVSTVRHLLQAAEKAKVQFTLSAGDCLVFNNLRVIHARTAFQPRMDGMDRWLKRAFVLGDCRLDYKLRNGFLPFDINQ